MAMLFVEADRSFKRGAIILAQCAYIGFDAHMTPERYAGAKCHGVLPTRNMAGAWTNM